VEALSAAGNGGDCFIPPITAGIHRLHVAGEFRVEGGISHVDLRIEDRLAGGYLRAESIETGGGDGEGGLGFDFPRVAVLIVGADLADELCHVLLITERVLAGEAESVIPALEPREAGDLEPLRRPLRILGREVVEHVGDIESRGQRGSGRSPVRLGAETFIKLDATVEIWIRDGRGAGDPGNGGLAEARVGFGGVVVLNAARRKKISAEGFATFRGFENQHRFSMEVSHDMAESQLRADGGDGVERRSLACGEELVFDGGDHTAVAHIIA